MEDETKNSLGIKKIIDLKTAGRGNSIRSRLFHFEKNDELLNETSRIKNQRDLVKERIQLMQDHSDRVSRNVYEKVKRDYNMQLESINLLFNEKKQHLKKELKELYLLREKLSVEITRHREILEEAQFRQMLNEFSLAQYQEVESFENKEITQLESDLSMVYQLIRVHEELFDPEDLGLPPKTKPVSESTTDATKTALNPAVHPVEKSTPSAETVTVFRAPEQPAPQAAPVVTNSPSEISEHAIEPQAAAPNPVVADMQPSSLSSIDPVKAVAPAPIADQSPDLSSSFDDLFNEDSDQEKNSLAESKSNIEKLLEEEPAVEITPLTVATPASDSQSKSTDEDDLSLEALLSEPDADSDYFNQDKVSESSINTLKDATHSDIKLPPQSDDEEPTAPIPQAPQEAAKPEPQIAATKLDQSITIGSNKLNTEQSSKPEEQVSQANKPINPDDSISNILESIKIEDEGVIAESKPAAQANDSVVGDYILTLIEGDLDQKVFALKDNTSIGRSPSNDITLKAPKVSRQHAAINKYNNQYIIIDLKSSNGVFVNGAKVDEYVLKDGDEVSVGGYRFTFHKKA